MEKKNLWTGFFICFAVMMGLSFFGHSNSQVQHVLLSANDVDIYRFLNDVRVNGRYQISASAQPYGVYVSDTRTGEVWWNTVAGTGDKVWTDLGIPGKAKKAN